MARKTTNSSTTKILIIGGYGNTGHILARLLLEHTNVRLVLAGRNKSRADAVADAMNQKFTGNKVTTAFVDASDPASLEAAFQDDVTMVIVASSTAKYVETVTNAALAAKIDYIDVQYSTEKTKYLESKKEEITKSGMCFITDGGFHPGLPVALIRYVAPAFAKMETAYVGSVIKMDWKGLENMSIETMEEFASEFTGMHMLEYKEKEWKEAGIGSLIHPREMDFGKPFGRQPCVPMFLEEIRSIPELYPSLNETGFYVGGLNWVVDWFITPIVMVVLKLWPQRAKRAMGRFLYWGLRTFSKPPYGTRLKVEATGLGKDGERLERTLELSHADGYALTAIPVAATVLQYLSTSEKSIRKPGLWLQGHIVDPEQLLLDMGRMGVGLEPPLGM